MSMTSKIGALFFKHHQSEAKRAKKKRPALFSLSDRRIAHQQNGPAISQQVLATPSPLQPPARVQHFDAFPDDLPRVTVPPPGTPAVEEPDTLNATWGDFGEGCNSANWCHLLFCKSSQDAL